MANSAHLPQSGTMVSLQHGQDGAYSAPPRDQRQLGQILLDDGAVETAHLLKAVIMRQSRNSRLGQILLAQGWVTPEALLRALARQWRVSIADLEASPADPRLIDAIGAEFCLAHGVVPWQRVGGITWVATARPESFADLCQEFPAEFGHVRMLLCTEDQIAAAVLAARRTALIRKAELRVPAKESCRTRNEARIGQITLALMAAIAVGLWFAPKAILSALTIWTMLTLVTQTGLKLAAFVATNRARKKESRPDDLQTMLPMISVMVPLFKESDVAGKLVTRLARLDYPRELTDILLVVEASDSTTQAALEQTSLPGWMRVIEVPDGPIQTKPRALNYALNFCRGQIVGVWDAEDRPEADQLSKVAKRFAEAPADVGCLQGALDYYNPRTNWLARCFTIEYAAWFRVLLPGVARLGLVVPLGGTTLFFRRDVLDQVDAWDAWNVTEDADLGVRMVRRGWRTEILDTTTDEEANCRALPWIKQRSRWLKGYAMTWGVHMRNPRALWRDLGPMRFISFQVQFLGTVSQYILAPVLWSFWLLTFGLPHPLSAPLLGIWGGHAMTALFATFILSELISIGIGIWAVRGAKHRHLIPWVPTLHLYFPLGCLAGWKAVYEVIVKPFYWDKTVHGLYDAIDGQKEGSVDLPAVVPIEMLGQIGGTKLSDRAMEMAANMTFDPDAVTPVANTDDTAAANLTHANANSKRRA